MSPSTSIVGQAPGYAASAGTGQRAGALAALMAAFKRWCAACITWRMDRYAIATLRAMSDRDLADIGLSRAGIETAVLTGLGRKRVIE